MNDNQFKLITFICFISISFSSVFCKNNQLSFDDLRLNEFNWNNNGLLNSRFLLPQLSTNKRFDYLDPKSNFNKEVELNDRLNEERKQLLSRGRLSNLENENEQDYRPKLKGIEGLIELNNEQQNPSNRFIDRSTDDKLHLNEKIRNLHNLLNNNNNKVNDELVNRQIRSDHTNKQRAYLEPNLINLLNDDLVRAFRREFFKKDNIGESDEIVELVNSKSSEKKNLNEEIDLNDNLKQQPNKKDIDKTTKQLNNYQSVVDIDQQQKSITKQSNNRPVFRKSKLNRVSKSTKFLGNNVSDCIKDCVSQGILHPVQCHSLC